MNDGHKIGCASEEWRTTVREQIIPWVLDGIELGDDVLELGPGYGATTEVLCERLPHLTAVEIDPELAAGISARYGPSGVDVVLGDASALDFGAARFSAVVTFSMLHHVHTPELQDDVFAQARRVLKAGGVFVATDSIDSPELREFHHDDIFTPVDPDELPARLERAGFTDIKIERNPWAWKAVASAG